MFKIQVVGWRLSLDSIALRGPGFNQHCHYLIEGLFETFPVVYTFEGLDGAKTYRIAEQDMKQKTGGMWRSGSTINIACKSYPPVSEWRWTVTNIPTGQGNGFWVSRTLFDFV